MTSTDRPNTSYQKDNGNAPPRHRRGNRVLATIAAFKIVKASLLVAVGIGAFRMMHHDAAQVLVRFIEHFRADPHNRYIHALLQKTMGITDHKLELLGVGTFFYALLFYIEGVGLLGNKRWAEWMTVITGGGLIPLEIFEIIRKPHGMRFAVLAINVAIVAYLARELKRTRTLRHGPD